eukprot:3632939-Ditylum_brightwellii.AAC.2
MLMPMMTKGALQVVFQRELAQPSQKSACTTLIPMYQCGQAWIKVMQIVSEQCDDCLCQDQ